MTAMRQSRQKWDAAAFSKSDWVSRSSTETFEIWKHILGGAVPEANQEVNFRVSFPTVFVLCHECLSTDSTRSHRFHARTAFGGVQPMD